MAKLQKNRFYPTMPCKRSNNDLIKGRVTGKNPSKAHM